uniref:Uncharacterized protein n=1 Tax=Rhizophora mucronata TaxID=61149 RepID=A0A2P2KS81_RHIMU
MVLASSNAPTTLSLLTFNVLSGPAFSQSVARLRNVGPFHCMPATLELNWMKLSPQRIKLHYSDFDPQRPQRWGRSAQPSIKQPIFLIFLVCVLLLHTSECVFTSE